MTNSLKKLFLICFIVYSVSGSEQLVPFPETIPEITKMEVAIWCPLIHSCNPIGSIQDIRSGAKAFAAYRKGATAAQIYALMTIDTLTEEHGRIPTQKKLKATYFKSDIQNLNRCYFSLLKTISTSTQFQERILLSLRVHAFYLLNNRLPRDDEMMDT